MKNRLISKALAVAGGTGLLILSAGRADADLIVIAPSFTASVGSTGTFDILLENTGTASVSIGGFSFGISTTNPGITFTSATINTVADPYIFGSDTLFGPNITITSGTSLTASDSPASVASYPVTAGETVGLGDVTYSISGGAATGPFTITLSPAATSLSDGSGNNIPIDTLTNGSINVTATPEPAGLGLFGCILLLTSAIVERRRIRRN